MDFYFFYFRHNVNRIVHSSRWLLTIFGSNELYAVRFFIIIEEKHIPQTGLHVMDEGGVSWLLLVCLKQNPPYLSHWILLLC